MIMLPKNSGFQIGENSPPGDEWSNDAIKEIARVRVEQRAVRVEGTVLDGDRDLVVGLMGGNLSFSKSGRVQEAQPRSRNREVEHHVVRSTADDIETGRAGVHVQAGHAQRVVVVPDGRSAVGIRILERGETGTPGFAEFGAALPEKKSYQVPLVA